PLQSLDGLPIERFQTRRPVCLLECGPAVVSQVLYRELGQRYRLVAQPLGDRLPVEEKGTLLRKATHVKVGGVTRVQLGHLRQQLVLKRRLGGRSGFDAEADDVLSCAAWRGGCGNEQSNSEEACRLKTGLQRRLQV